MPAQQSAQPQSLLASYCPDDLHRVTVVMAMTVSMDAVPAFWNLLSSDPHVLPVELGKVGGHGPRVAVSTVIAGEKDWAPGPSVTLRPHLSLTGTPGTSADQIPSPVTIKLKPKEAQ